MSDAPRILASLVSGLLFGLGLAVSGMLDPARVLGFLDVAGRWDPSLAFVLAGAVAVSALSYWARARMAAPALAPRFEIPTGRAIDGRLIVGAALFGIGWGLVGICPGPAVATLSLGLVPIVVFVLAMLAGMALFAALDRRSLSAKAASPRA